MVTIRDDVLARLKSASQRGNGEFNYQAAVNFELATRCFKDREQRDGTQITPYLADCVGPTVALLTGLKEEGSLTWQTGPSAMEWPLSDEAYLKKIDAITQIPAELNSRAFLNLLDNDEVPAVVEFQKSETWQAMLREKPLFESVAYLEEKKKEFKKEALYRFFDDLNAKRAEEGQPPVLASIYSARGGPGGDNGASGSAEIRLTISYPGDPRNGFRDRWIAVAPYNHVSELFSIVTVSPGNPPTAAYRDHKRSGASVSSPYEPVFPSASCKKCHQEGLIVPHRSDVAPHESEKSRFEALVAKANSYGPQKHEGVPHPELDLPPLGEDLAGLPECLASGTSAVAPARRELVLESAKCANCHSGDRGIYPPFGKSIGEFVQVGLMPSNHNRLTESERKRLAQCLTDSYFQKPTFFKEYMDANSKGRHAFRPEPPGALWKAVSKIACLPVLDTRSLKGPLEGISSGMKLHKNRMLERLHPERDALTHSK